MTKNTDTMEKKFKCGDKIVFRHKTLSGEPDTLWMLGIFSHYERGTMALVGNAFYPLCRIEALPYEGNGWLVGTDIHPDEEIELKSGTIVIVSNVAPDMSGLRFSDWHLRRISKVVGDKIIAYPDEEWKFCIPFAKISLDDRDAVRRNILTAKNGKLCRVHND